MKLIGSGLILAVLAAPVMSGSVLASDLELPTKAPIYTKAPPISPVYNWSGFYAGAHGGYATDDRASALFNVASQATTVLGAGGATIIPNPLLTTPPFGLATDANGAFGGFQIGYNWQAVGSPLVFGLEADASFGRLRREDAKPFIVEGQINGDSFDYSGIARLRQAVDAFGTVRGRVGYAFDTLLLYATGGFSWAHAKTTFGTDSMIVDPSNLSPEQFATLSAGSSASTKDTRYGYAAGGGGEWAFNQHWSVKAEYVYLGFTSGGGTLGLPGFVADVSKFHLHTAKGGINYHF